MAARVLVIGLDAAEATLIERWASEGHMPTLRRLMQGGTTYRVQNSLTTLPGAIWPELETGISCGQIPHYYHPGQIHTGEAERRPIAIDDVNPEHYFWVRAARRGLKVAAVDMPQAVEAPDMPGLQLLEWGLHDRNFAVASNPPGVLDDVRHRHGDHPVDSCDTHGRTVEGYKTLLGNLKRGIAAKTRLLEDLLVSDNWDLFAGCFGETHCVGHQFWHFQDPAHPWYDPLAPDDFRRAILDIYAQADAGIGRLIDRAGPGAHVVVVASHGMGPYTGGPNLLREVLARIGMSTTPDKPLAHAVRAFQRSQAPAARFVRELVKPMIGKSRLRALQGEFNALYNPLGNAHTKACEVPNNRCGAIRLNLKGREPFGCVAPGNEATSLIEDIRSALNALRDPVSGEPIVLSTVTAREAFGPNHHPDVPDLMITFRDDLGVLDSCTSERLGLIVSPVYKRSLPRSGDHTTESRIWLAGDGIGLGRRHDTGNVLDLAPTVLSLLKAPPPETTVGRSLAFRAA